ncbi:MAG: hypothetical protein R2764_10615 [Bacteroidales bacterium]
MKTFMHFTPLHILIVCMLFVSLNISAQIQSTLSGGDWNDPDTWQGSIVPGSGNDVQINGPVFVTTGSSCNDIYIVSGASLQNKSNGNYALSVNGDITNEGTITNNYYTLTLYIYGNVIQNGVWSNQATYLSDNTSQEIFASQPFTGSYFYNSNASNNIDVTSNSISFIGTVVDLNYANLLFGNGSFSLDGGYLTDVNILANEIDFTLHGNAFLQNADIATDYARLHGIVQVRTGVDFFDNNLNVVVEVVDTLQNSSVGNYALIIDGDVLNNGLIRDNYYSLTLYISGALTNNGIWSNGSTNLNGSETQNLSFFTAFDGANLTNSNPDGVLSANTHLAFNNTIVDLNYDTLYMTAGTDQIALNGGYFTEAVIFESNPPYALNINLTNSAHFRIMELNAGEVVINDVFDFISPFTVNGNVRVEGTFQNKSIGSYTADINGSIVNNGSIQNNYYNLSINCSGDITHNGTWSNNYTTLDGDMDQVLNFSSPFTGYYFKKLSTNGNLVASSDLHFNGTTIELDYDTLAFDQGMKLTLENSVLLEADILKTSMSPNTFILDMQASYFQQCEFVADTISTMNDIQFFIAPVNFYGNLIVNGNLRNRNNGNYTANVSGSVINRGTITNNSYNAYLNISGDVYNYGTWNNHTVNLNGDNNQQLFFYNPVNITFFNNTNDNGYFIAQTSLDFIGSSIDLDNDTVKFMDGYQMTLDNSYLNEAVLINEAAKSSDPFEFSVINNAYFARTKIVSDEIELDGNILVATTPVEFYGTVTNHGTLTNYGNSNYTLSVFGNLINESTISDNYYNFYINLSGNLSNHGMWNNNGTYLFGSDDHILNFTEEFSSYYFVNNEPAGNIIAETSLLFNDSRLDFKGCTLTLADHALLSVQNGWIDDVTIAGNDIEFFGQGSFCQYTSFPDVTLYGDVQTGHSVSFSGDLTNEGTLRNYGNSSYTISVQGDIQNNGTISNNYYYLYVEAKSDIFNNGTWNNNYTLLNGGVEQHIHIQNGHAIESQLRLDAGYTGTYTWFGSPFTGPLSLHPSHFGNSNSKILYFLNPVSGGYAGTYYATNGGGTNSPAFVIEDESITEYQLDLTVLLEGPFNGTEMETHLNSAGALPLSHPYLSYPWTYPGSESVGTIPNSDVVDWVIVELRDAATPAEAIGTTQVKRMAGLILNNGKIVGMDGISNLTFTEEITNNLFVVINHRNHLAVMSAVALNESGGVYTYDFTYDTWNSYGGPLASKNLRDNLDPIYGMMGGDSNKDGQITINDKYNEWTSKAGFPVTYDLADFNLDTEINNQDKNDSWAENLGAATQIPQ